MVSCRFLPSPIVPQTLFCSLHCLESSLESYHRIESKLNYADIFELTTTTTAATSGNNNNNFDEISGSVLLALRAIVLAFSDMRRERKEKEEGEEEIEANLSQLVKTKRISLLRDMISHGGLVKTNEESLSLVVKTVLLMAILEKMGVLMLMSANREVTASLSESRLEAGVVIMQLFEIIQFNTHPIDQVRTMNDSRIQIYYISMHWRKNFSISVLL